MRDCSYIRKYGALLQPDIVALAARIHEYKGEQLLALETRADMLTRLKDVSKIQSAEAADKIEGICTSDERLKKIVRDKTVPETGREREIAGYLDVLTAIRENNDFIPLKPSLILRLHFGLYGSSGANIGGSYRSADNATGEEDAQGDGLACIQPLPAGEAPEAMERVCAAFDEACKSPEYDPLLLIPMFVLDFLCIRPFSGGNGRTSRLLTLLLLCRAGYIVGRYISLERMIEQTKDAYYEALRQSSSGWREGRNEYAPFVRYMLGVVAAAYSDFSGRLKLLSAGSLSKPDRVRGTIRDSLGKITKTEILQKCPDISQVTVQRALNELVKSGEILKLGGGRYTSYIWNREIER